MKIKTKIILVFSVLCATAASGVYFFFARANDSVITTQTYQALEDVADTRADEVRSLVSEQKNDVWSLSFDPSIVEVLSSGSGDEEKKQKLRVFLQKDVSLSKGYNEIFLLDEKGKVFLSSDQSHEGVDKSSDPYFLSGENNLFIKEPYFSNTTRRINYAISAPVHDVVSKKRVGLIVVRFNMDKLDGIFSGNGELSQKIDAFLVNSEKKMLTEGKIEKGNVIGSKILSGDTDQCFRESEAVSGHETASYPQKFIDHQGVESLGTTVTLSDLGWCLVVKIDADGALFFTRSMEQKMAAFFFIGVLFFVVSGYFVARNIVGPIERLSRGAEMIGKGDLRYRVIIDSKDEIGDLSRAIDSMARRLRDMSENIGKRVEDQTKELWKKHTAIQEQQVAMLNVLDDVKKLKANYYELLENSRDGIIVVGTDGKVVWVSAVVEKMYGVPADRTKGLPFTDFIDQSNVERVRQDFPKILQGVYVVEEYLTVTSTGKKYWVEVLGRKTEFEGKTVAFLQLRDVTDKKLAAERLRESEERFAAIYEYSKDALMIMEPPDWRFTDANPSCIALFGVKDKTEFLKLHFWDLSPLKQPDGQGSENKAKEMIGKAVWEGSNYFEWKHHKGTGEDFDAAVLLSRINIRGRGGIQATIRDITEKKQAEMMI